MVIVALLVLLLDVVDAVLIAHRQVLGMGGERVYNPDEPRPPCDPANVIEGILAPHGALGAGKLGQGHLQNGREENPGPPRAGGDLCARFAVLMKEVREILASMCYQVVQVLRQLSQVKAEEGYYLNKLTRFQ